MGLTFSQYLTENKVSALEEMTLELMVDKCIKEGQSKDGAVQYAQANDFPGEVVSVLRRLPSSIFEALIEADVTFESLMEEYSGDLTEMIDDYLYEGELFEGEFLEGKMSDDEDNQPEDMKDKKKMKKEGKEEKEDDESSDDKEDKKDKEVDEACGNMKMKMKGKKKLEETDDADDLGTNQYPNEKKK